MSQNDFNIANQGFPSFRSDMNSALQALASNSAGATEPATTYAYQWWYDSTTDILKMRNAGNDAWISFASFDQATDAWSLGSLVVDGNLVVDTDTLVVDSTNNRVSIGTASSAFPFHVNAGTANTAAMFQSEDANASIYLIDSNTTGGTSASHGLLTSGDELSVRAVDHVIIETGTTEWLRVDLSGNVMIGATVVTAVDTGLGGAIFDAATNNRRILKLGHTDTSTAYRSLLQCFGGLGSYAGGINCNNTATQFATSSDYRLKQDWQPMIGASDRVLALNPVNFAWKADGSRVDGFLAHEAQEVVPEAVSGAKDEVDADGNPVYQGIDQSKLVPLLTAALQEALTEIAALKDRVTALEAI